MIAFEPQTSPRHPATKDAVEKSCKRVNKQIKEKPGRFYESIVNPSTKSQAQAAREGGYSIQRARVTASETVAKRNVRSAVDRRRRPAPQASFTSSQCLGGKVKKTEIGRYGRTEVAPARLSASFAAVLGSRNSADRKRIGRGERIRTSDPLLPKQSDGSSRLRILQQIPCTFSRRWSHGCSPPPQPDTPVHMWVAHPMKPPRVLPSCQNCRLPGVAGRECDGRNSEQYTPSDRVMEPFASTWSTVAALE